jgi:predicted PurR-regulated permease PerM
VDKPIFNLLVCVRRVHQHIASLQPIRGCSRYWLRRAGVGLRVSGGKAIFIAIVILLLAYHWTLDGPRIIQSLLPLVSKDQREGISELISAMETKIGSYLAGQGILCLVIGIMALVAYMLIGLPNALVLALVAGVLEAVPMIGPLLGVFLQR